MEAAGKWCGGLERANNSSQHTRRWQVGPKSERLSTCSWETLLLDARTGSMEILFFGAIVGLAPMPTFTPPPTCSPFLDAVLDATNIALDSCDVTAKDRDGSWCFDANQIAFQEL